MKPLFNLFIIMLMCVIPSNMAFAKSDDINWVLGGTNENVVFFVDTKSYHDDKIVVLQYLRDGEYFNGERVGILIMELSFSCSSKTTTPITVAAFNRQYSLIKTVNISPQDRHPTKILKGTNGDTNLDIMCKAKRGVYQEGLGDTREILDVVESQLPFKE